MGYHKKCLQQEGQKGEESKESREREGSGRAALDETRLAKNIFVVLTSDLDISTSNVRSVLARWLPVPAKDAVVAGLTTGEGNRSGLRTSRGLRGSGDSLKVGDISGIGNRPSDGTRSVSAMAGMDVPTHVNRRSTAKKKSINNDKHTVKMLFPA